MRSMALRRSRLYSPPKWQLVVGKTWFTCGSTGAFPRFSMTTPCSIRLPQHGRHGVILWREIGSLQGVELGLWPETVVLNGLARKIVIGGHHIVAILTKKRGVLSHHFLLQPPNARHLKHLKNTTMGQSQQINLHIFEKEQLWISQRTSTTSSIVMWYYQIIQVNFRRCSRTTSGTCCGQNPW